MSAKLLKGTGIDLHIDPNGIEYNTRGDLSNKFIGMKALEFKRYTIFWSYFLSCIGLIVLSIFITKFLIFVLAVVVYLTVKIHFKYLQAWSNWNKFARKSVAVIDGDNEFPVYDDLLTPWVDLKKHMDPKSIFFKQAGARPVAAHGAHGAHGAHASHAPGMQRRSIQAVQPIRPGQSVRPIQTAPAPQREVINPIVKSALGLNSRPTGFGGN
ncbi:MAG: hypothetical protein Q7K42_00330 [Candidatus Diapherotrites archaeon]|nr:hypothetical protein [Candidatus Diapherotrites archaeon]